MQANRFGQILAVGIGPASDYPVSLSMGKLLPPDARTGSGPARMPCGNPGGETNAPS